MPSAPMLPKPNRRSFRAAAERAPCAGAAMVLDIDAFSRLNAQLGERHGDLVLLRVLERARVKVGSRGTVERIGDDEFGILLSTDLGTSELHRLCTALVTDPAAGVAIEGGPVVAVSLGVAPRRPGSTGDQVLEDARGALARAKAAGGGRYVLHSGDPVLGIDDAALRAALAAGEFHLDYQPVVGLRSPRLFSVEALLRWTRADGSRVSPLDFIGVAEESGFITELGGWVLDEACTALAGWRRRHPATAPNCVNVNLSSVQLDDGELLARVAGALTRSHLPASALMVEVTESLSIDDAAADGALFRLRRLGIGIAVDDFGTGYSSLSHLRRLPLTCLKLDRAFINDLDGEGGAVVRSILGLSRALGLPMVAEGIETADQASYVRNVGFPLGQGYLLGRPVPAGTIAVGLGADADAQEAQDVA